MVVPLGVARSKMPLSRRVPFGVKIEGAKRVAITGDFSNSIDDGIALAKTPNPVRNGNLVEPGWLCPQS
jgi:hypothetical protein